MKNKKIFFLGTFIILSVSFLFSQYSSIARSLPLNPANYVNIKNATVFSASADGSNFKIVVGGATQQNINTPLLSDPNSVKDPQAPIFSNATAAYYAVDTKNAKFPVIMGMSGLENSSSVSIGDVVSVSGKLNIPLNGQGKLDATGNYNGTILADTIDDSSFLTRSFFEGNVVSLNKDGSFTFSSHNINICNSPLALSGFNFLKKRCDMAGCYVSGIQNDLRNACTSAGCFSPLISTPADPTTILEKSCAVAGCYKQDRKPDVVFQCTNSGCYSPSFSGIQSLCLASIGVIDPQLTSSGLPMNQIFLPFVSLFGLMTTNQVGNVDILKLFTVNNGLPKFPVIDNTDLTQNNSALYVVKHGEEKVFSSSVMSGSSIKDIAKTTLMSFSDINVGDKIQVFVDYDKTDTTYTPYKTMTTGIISNPKYIEDYGSNDNVLRKQLEINLNLSKTLKPGSTINFGQNLHDYIKNPENSSVVRDCVPVGTLAEKNIANLPFCKTK